MTDADATNDSDTGPRPAGRDGRREDPADYEARLVVTLGALAIAARLVWVLAVPTHPVGDFAMYWESAGHLVEHGAFDPEFIYMPGYVVALAAVRWLGGGLFAAKLLGVAAGGLATAAVTGLAARLFDRRSAVAAGLLCALWPAGIAVSSVVGTDMPAAALLVTAAWLLLRDANARPVRAAVLFGIALGVAAYVRAVALPFALFSALLWIAVRAPWRRVVGCTALSCAVVFLMLVPWGLRNKARYGELFLTDSHGGHTALVGANPNSEGTYSRSLNLLFTKGTGYRLLDQPARQRASDRAAYALAKEWTVFEPAYALGLVAAKADRLLTHERNLLYWPLFRQGVLTAAARGSFDAHRTALERLADWFWWAVVAAAILGVALAVRARAALALAPLVFPLALAGIYTVFFSEVRYHLAIAPLLFPYAAFGLSEAAAAVARRDLRHNRNLLVAAAAIVVVFALWFTTLAAGAALRARHRWAVSVCAYPTPGATKLCAWRRLTPRGGDSPVRGSWDGVGFVVGNRPADGVAVSARTILPALAAGRYRLRAALALGGGGPSGKRAIVSARVGDSVIARALVPAPSTPQGLSSGGAPEVPGGSRLAGVFDHAGGPLLLDFDLESDGSGWMSDGESVWISELVVERFQTSDIIPPR
jgi:4-amino-4-deoxy-L-arabinose transferase-like glycosyltransferase